MSRGRRRDNAQVSGFNEDVRRIELDVRQRTRVWNAFFMIG